MLKQIKWGSVLLSVVYIATGALLCVFPTVSEDVICKVIGIVAALYGLVNITTYFLLDVRESMFRNEFVIGIMSLIGALLVIMKQSLVMNLVPIILGLVIITNGFVKMQRALVAFRIGYNKASWYFALGIVSVILGLVLIFWMNGIKSQKTVFTTIGAGLVFCGVSDLFITFFLANKLHKYIREYALKEEKEKEGEMPGPDEPVPAAPAFHEPELIDPAAMEPAAVKPASPLHVISVDELMADKPEETTEIPLPQAVEPELPPAGFEPAPEMIEPAAEEISPLEPADVPAEEGINPEPELVVPDAEEADPDEIIELK